MIKKDDVYREAETLAKFSNIDPMDTDPLSARSWENFRNNYPKFFPSALWDAPGITIPSGGPVGQSKLFWLSHQELVRDAWQSKFRLENCIRQITNIGDLSQLRQSTMAVAEMILKSDIVPKYTLPKPEVWPCQRAVMFLGVESWRVRFCASCGNRYAAARSPQKFCSDSCFQKSRKEAKKAWWSEHGQNWRASKRKSNRKALKIRKYQ